MIGVLHPAMANPAFSLQCNASTNVDQTAAAALCDAFAGALTRSFGGKSQTATMMQLDVNTLHSTAINLTLNLTGGNGRTRSINRAFSASDTTITPAMQDAFLQKLISAIPVHF